MKDSYYQLLLQAHHYQRKEIIPMFYGESPRLFTKRLVLMLDSYRDTIREVEQHLGRRMGP